MLEVGRITTTTTDEGISQHKLGNHGWLLSTSHFIRARISSVSFLRVPAARTVFWFPENDI